MNNIKEVIDIRENVQEYLFDKMYDYSDFLPNEKICDDTDVMDVLIESFITELDDEQLMSLYFEVTQRELLRLNLKVSELTYEVNRNA